MTNQRMAVDVPGNPEIEFNPDEYAAASRMAMASLDRWKARNRRSEPGMDRDRNEPSGWVGGHEHEGRA